MNRIILISSLCLLLSACGEDSKETATKNATNNKAKSVAQTTHRAKAINKKTAIAEAKMITKAFTGALKTELKAAMKAGGPINALGVCNKKAIPLTKKAAKDHNAIVTRVSLKNRNPKNIPNFWQKAVLNDFDKRAAKGEDVMKMGYSSIVDTNGKKQLRFMKALPTGKVCLSCHGSKIKAKVKAKISQLYPADKATGYKKGQVRGAVVVVKDLN